MDPLAPHEVSLDEARDFRAAGAGGLPWRRDRQAEGAR